MTDVPDLRPNCLKRLSADDKCFQLQNELVTCIYKGITSERHQETKGLNSKHNEKLFKIVSPANFFQN